MPVKTVSVRQYDKPWITEEIKQMMRNKNKLHKKAKIFNTDQSWKSFRQTRNDHKEKEIRLFTGFRQSCVFQRDIRYQKLVETSKVIHEQQGI